MDSEHFSHAHIRIIALEKTTNMVEDAKIPTEIEQALAHFYQVKDLADALEAVTKRVKAVKQRLATEVIPEMMDDKDVTSVTCKVDGLRYRFTVSEKLAASIRKGLKDEAFAWLRKSGLEELIVETVNAQTLSASAREMADKGMELDDELFNVAYLRNTSVTKVK